MNAREILERLAPEMQQLRDLVIVLAQFSQFRSQFPLRVAHDCHSSGSAYKDGATVDAMALRNLEGGGWRLGEKRTCRSCVSEPGDGREDSAGS